MIPQDATHKDSNGDYYKLDQQGWLSKWIYQYKTWYLIGEIGDREFVKL